MEDGSPDKPDAAAALRAALRTARIEEAERSQALAELRIVEVARLEALQEALAPVLAQVPRDVEMFDCGLVPGPHPRLFIDMLAFVEMAHDRRFYRFVQVTRHARVLLAETEGVEDMVEAVTAYVARRLVEREKALVAAEPLPEAARPAPRRNRPALAGAIALEYLGLASVVVLLLVVFRYRRELWSWLSP